MFNIPVPGGTTAHGVGGTLVAIVLGPWAAVIAVSVALIIQALFFGDGGDPGDLRQLLQHGDRAAVRRLLHLPADRRTVATSCRRRRVWAAGSAAYVGITVSAARGRHRARHPADAVHRERARRCTARTACRQAVPAMLLAHVFGASMVEGVITALGLAYLQQRHPEYLTAAARPCSRRPTLADGPGGRAAALAAGGRGGRRWRSACSRSSGWLTGGGDPGHAVRRRLVDASTGPRVATMLLVVAVIAAILDPARLVASCPGASARVGTAFVAGPILAPLGLIAPGFAYGEGGADDVQAAFGYVPEGLHDLSSTASARRSTTTTCRCRSSATPTRRCGTPRSATRSPASSASSCAAARSTA